MRLKSISIENFRNHRHLEFEPGQRITNIYGCNGSGKTTILEAIHYCALTRGFSGNSERDCLMFGEEMFAIRSSFESDHGGEIKVVVVFTPHKEKRILVNDQELQTFSSHIGLIPCVTFTPRELVIITGGPAERRRFMDTAICQHDRKYLSDLMQYRRVLQQRNALLASHDDPVKIEIALEVLTEQLAIHAVEIVMARERFISNFSVMLDEVYRWHPEGVQSEIVYQSSLLQAEKQLSKERMQMLFSARYRDMKKQELLRRQTLAGPHRDDLQLFLNGREIRKYASQGQQRAFLVAMKMTMHAYLHEHSEEMPVTLLDDLFSELDAKVSSFMLETLSSKGQVIITSTDKKNGKDITFFSIDEYRKTSGQVR
ncbi:DNA recombination protein RecF [Chlorobaculum limnaeum]|uniref:DNA replication and repair protein RecF n=1 Tax=Chlorobaculum limnaeum TaxID=274537 RepID=A0A1D8CX59_CHLLM|nr:DNA replication and repair protein RecF [Chlorobaculum limnaeum]AOS82681.1 DNA recombination protein RecF [Chlorobaculum limnaeum]